MKHLSFIGILVVSVPGLFAQVKPGEEIKPLTRTDVESIIKEFLNQGEVHGNIQVEAQYYLEDSLIDAPIVEEKVAMNGFGNVNYINGPITAGVRFESYQNALLGYPEGYRGNGIPYRYFTYTGEQVEFTVGNFYEQFGNGLIFRTYEERGLGYDNVMDGIRVGFNIGNAAKIKGIIGNQRIFFDLGEGIVRGIDLEVSVNDALSFFKESGHRLSIGGSFVSKYQEDNNTELILPENVGSGAVRLDYRFKNVHFGGEYVRKANDPSFDNGFIYRNGEVLYLQGAYSRSGLGINVSAMRSDNMSFRSEREQEQANLLINFVPALTRQHTYNLLASLYPYATQPLGQMGGQVDITKKFKRKTFLGGRYGTGISLNMSTFYNIDTNLVYDSRRESNPNLAYEYESDFFSFGEKYWTEINVELTKKFSKFFSLIFDYSYLEYNQNVIEGKTNPYELIYASVAVADMTFHLNQKHAIRTELQGLFTEQDKGSWATWLIEYTYAPHWYIALMDQYNFGNDDPKKQLHYYNVSTGYNNKGTRIMLSYGRQRAGIFCVGGVCRVVPASNGFYISVTQSF